MRKPTVQELERILNETEERPIIVLPDGSITVDRRRKGKGFIHTAQTPLVDSY